jgi:hypothetical protein
MGVIFSPCTCATVLKGGCQCLAVNVYAYCKLQYDISQGSEMGAHLKSLFYYIVTLYHVGVSFSGHEIQ